ncbi:MAG: hypothetical protein ACFFBD_16555, partial [Candidatus Hodarchaeota archaeon]
MPSFLSINRNKEYTQKFPNSGSKADNNQKKNFSYFQMRLKTKNITPEIENRIKNRVIKSVKIRQAMIDDIPTLVEIYNQAFLFSKEPYSPISINQMKRVFNFNSTIVLIASLYGIDIGFIVIYFEGENSEVGIISCLGILPRWRGRGVG